MLDRVDSSANSSCGNAKSLAQRLPQALHSARAPQPVHQAPRLGSVASHMQGLGPSMGGRVVIDRDVIHVFDRDSGLGQAGLDRLRGKTCPVLDASRTLLLQRAGDSVVYQQRGGRIAVPCVEAENDGARSAGGLGHGAGRERRGTGQAKRRIDPRGGPAPRAEGAGINHSRTREADWRGTSFARGRAEQSAGSPRRPSPGTAPRRDRMPRLGLPPRLAFPWPPRTNPRARSATRFHQATGRVAEAGPHPRIWALWN